MRRDDEAVGADHHVFTQFDVRFHAGAGADLDAGLGTLQSTAASDAPRLRRGLRVEDPAM